MLKIKLIVVGSLKESYWREAFAEYCKRLVPYVQLEIKELKETPFRDIGERENVMKQEGERILAAISRDSYVIVLDREGKQLSSEKFAQSIEREGESGRELIFIIGGALGLAPEVKKRAYLLLSFGDLTFPHQLIRIVLAEQLYRAVTILRGKAYHY